MTERLHQVIPQALVDWKSQLRTSWFWLFLLGVGLIICGVLAGLVATIWVVLPYDEAFVGLSRAQLIAANSHLLPFMVHDRITFAGALISIGLLYAQLAWYGVRRGSRWARRAIVISSVVGFASFFLFLGFGYLDPLHATGSVILFVFFVLGLRGQTAFTTNPPEPVPNVNEGESGLYRWRGPIMFGMIGVGLMVGGLTISGLGATTVFVPEDLAFMNTTAQALQQVSPHMIPLIAHDRAGVGGALLSNGAAVFLIALWGCRSKALWVWWALLTAGTPAFGATIAVHLMVGYGNALHLAPVVLAVGFYVVGLVWSYSYLCGDSRPQIYGVPA